jgi:hypothetical protein
MRERKNKQIINNGIFINQLISKSNQMSLKHQLHTEENEQGQFRFYSTVTTCIYSFSFIVFTIYYKRILFINLCGNKNVMKTEPKDGPKLKVFLRRSYASTTLFGSIRLSVHVYPDTYILIWLLTTITLV